MVGERDSLGGRRSGNGGLLGHRVLFVELALCLCAMVIEIECLFVRILRQTTGLGRLV